MYQFVENVYTHCVVRRLALVTFVMRPQCSRLQPLTLGFFRNSIYTPRIKKGRSFVRTMWLNKTSQYHHRIIRQYSKITFIKSLMFFFTRAMLTSGWAYKHMSSLRHSVTSMHHLLIMVMLPISVTDTYTKRQIHWCMSFWKRAAKGMCTNIHLLTTNQVFING